MKKRGLGFANWEDNPNADKHKAGDGVEGIIPTYIKHRVGVGRGRKSFRESMQNFKNKPAGVKFR